MSPAEFLALVPLERLDSGGDNTFHRVKHAGRQAVLIESSSWVPWADPGIFRFAGSHRHLVDLLGTELPNHPQATRALIAWAEGPSVHELLRAGPLSEQESLVVLRDVLDALVTLDAARGHDGAVLDLCHGALSPRWMHIDAQGHTTLAGAGLGRLKPEGRSTGLNEALLYVAPEAIVQEEMSSRSDVFSLGALFHHFVSGFGVFGTPVGDTGHLDVIRAMRSGTPQIKGIGFASLVLRLTAPFHVRPNLEEAVTLFDDALANVEVDRVRQGLSNKATS